jgi:hypothetical protein
MRARGGLEIIANEPISCNNHDWSKSGIAKQFRRDPRAWVGAPSPVEAGVSLVGLPFFRKP